MLIYIIMVLIQTLEAHGGHHHENDARFVLNHPLTNSTFNHWKASGSAVFLQNKVILSPERAGMDGLVYAKNTFNLAEFCFQIDISVHNQQSSSFANGEFRIYLLRDNPMKSSTEFANGLDGMYDGIEIAIREGRHRNSDTSKGAPARKHSILSEVRDDEFVV